MSEKPKALKLADLLNEATTVLDEPFHHKAIAENCNKAAAELRRLHAENKQLRKALEELLSLHDDPCPYDAASTRAAARAILQQEEKNDR
jgi:cytochrome c556